jgi:hypothetical protein
MSLNTKYTSLDEILERVRRNYGFEEVYAEDCKEWIWDIIGKMGAPEMLIEKETPIKVSNWRAELPIDLYDLSEHIIKDAKTNRVITYSTDSFHMSNSTKEDVENVELEQGRSVVYEDSERAPSEETVYNSVVIPEYDVVNNLAPTYKINNNYIFTSHRDMELIMYYKAFPMDEKKLEPLIPDHPKVISAVVSYLGERIAFKLMLVDKLSERKYEMIKQDSMFNTGSAITASRMVSIPEIENIKNRLNTLYRNQFPYRTGFRE